MAKPEKKLGQHWLRDKAILESIVEAGQIKTDDQVLEIGPGQGTLTDVLLKKGAKITAVEFDVELARALTKKYANQTNIKIINADIRKFDFNQLPTGYKIVANIPYYLTSLLLRQICESQNPPSLAVLLVQKEVAERVVAEPGQMSILSVLTQMYFEATLGKIVPAQFFTPPPEVDSRVLILKRRVTPLFGNQDANNVFRLVKAGFSERRKKLRSSLSGGLGISKLQAEELLKKANIDPNLRAQNLGLQDWLKLVTVINFSNLKSLVITNQA